MLRNTGFSTRRSTLLMAGMALVVSAVVIIQRLYEILFAAPIVFIVQDGPNAGQSFTAPRFFAELTPEWLTAMAVVALASFLGRHLVPLQVRLHVELSGRRAVQRYSLLLKAATAMSLTAALTTIAQLVLAAYLMRSQSLDSLRWYAGHGEEIWWVVFVASCGFAAWNSSDAIDSALNETAL